MAKTTRGRLLPIRIYRVQGISMVPAYQPGDIVLGWSWFRARPGQVIIVNHRGRPLLKRIRQRQSQQIWLEGDNSSHSTDSRHFGPLALKDIAALAIFKL